MRRLAKYLKPYTVLLLGAIVLLFAQANFDLALPDYLSRIVNYGIQQGGVENAVPVAIRQSEMDKITIFMSAEDKTSVLNDYTLVDKNSPDYGAYVEQYPALSNEPVYVLNDAGQSEIEHLNSIMAKPLLVVHNIEQVMADPSKAAQMGGANLGFDITKIPPGTDVFAMMSQLPAAQLTRIKDAIDQQFTALGDKMVTQAAVAAVRSEYEALGMDMGKVQNNYILRVGGIMLLLTLLSGLCMYHRSGIPVCQNGSRCGTRCPSGCVRKCRKLFQRRIRQVLHCLFDHTFDQRHHPDPDGGCHHDTYDVLRAYFGDWRCDPHAWERFVHVVVDRRGRDDIDQPDSDRFLGCAAQIQSHPKTGGSPQPGIPRKPGRYDGHPRFQYAGFRGRALRQSQR